MNIEYIKNQLQRLAGLDKECKLFGANYHQYKNYPISEEDLCDLEQFLGNSLPEDYRIFLKEIGYGAGFQYGLFSPKQIIKEHQEWDIDYYEPEKNAWVIPSYVELKKSDLQIFLDRYQAQKPQDPYALMNAAPIIPSIQGAVIIGTQGCSYYNVLVIAGECKGFLFDINIDDALSLPVGLIVGKSKEKFKLINGVAVSYNYEIEYRDMPFTFEEKYIKWLEGSINTLQSI